MKPLLLVITLVSLRANGQYNQYGGGYGNDPRSQTYERKLLDSVFNLCRQPLFARSNVTATSWWHDRYDFWN